MIWTEDDDTLLRRLWEVDKISSGQLAENFPGRTRNAVIGRIHRLGLEKRGNENRVNAAKRQAERARPIMRKPVRPKIEKIDAPIAPALPAEPLIDWKGVSEIFGANFAGVEYSQLREGMCRAPIDKRGNDGLILSCGRPQGTDINGGDSSYCPQHHRMFHKGTDRSLADG